MQSMAKKCNAVQTKALPPLSISCENIAAREPEPSLISYEIGIYVGSRTLIKHFDVKYCMEP